MYLEFYLPDYFSDRVIAQHLHVWSDQHQIPYNTKVVKSHRRVTFDHDHLYDFFVMSWNPPDPIRGLCPALSTWRIVVDPNNKTTFDSVL